jgi:predicted O-methyltransferase YrrM
MGIDTAGLDKVIAKFIGLDAETRAKINRRSSPLDDLVYLALMLRANEVEDVIEIGTFLGQSACFLAPAIRGRFHTININPREVAIAKQTVESFGIKNVVFHTGDSLEVIPRLLPKVSARLGAVYIDGNHSYKYAIEEFRLVEPILASKPSAAAFFDDAHKLHPDGAEDGGVPRAVAEVGASAMPFIGHRVAIMKYGSFKTL